VRRFDAPFPLASGRATKLKGGGSGPDSREPKPTAITKPRDMYEPGLQIGTLKIKSTNFR
jgi:hypothetical protein